MNIITNAIIRKAKLLAEFESSMSNLKAITGIHDERLFDLQEVFDLAAIVTRQSTGLYTKKSIIENIVIKIAAGMSFDQAKQEVKDLLNSIIL